MKKILIILTLVLATAFSASAQYNSYSTRRSAYRDCDQVTAALRYLQVSQVANASSIDDNTPISTQMAELEKKISKNKSTCILGLGISGIGGVMYLVGLNQITDARTDSDINAGSTVAYTGIAIGSVGALISTISGMIWSQAARDLNTLRLVSSGANVGVVYSF